MTVDHQMTPTAVAILLGLALIVDYLSIGPNSIRDRLAFLLALPAVYEGFNGSPLDQWTVGLLSAGIDQLKEMGKGAYIAGAITSTVLGAAVGVLAIYTAGALMPDKFSKRFGRFAALKFPTSPMHRLNYKLWVCAFLLGMLSDLTHGLVGQTVTGCIVALDNVVAPVPSLLFGSV